MNKKEGNRHIEGSLHDFKEFLRKDLEKLHGSKPAEPLSIGAGIFNERICIRFRDFLVGRHTGKTPANYFGRFKSMMKDATDAGYFKRNPAEKVIAKKGKDNPKKDTLTYKEFLYLCDIPSRTPRWDWHFFSLISLGYVEKH